MTSIEVNRRSFEDENYEVVERKGVGHPDTFSDSISDIGCQALCEYYLEEYDYVLPHHLNKVSILNGETIPEFQGGKIEEPIKIILGGVAIDKVIDGDEEIEIPVFNIVVDAVKQYLNDRFPHLEVDKQTEFIDRIRSGSVELEDIRNKEGIVTDTCEDTSMGVGYAPLSDAEEITLEVEKRLNSEDFKEKHPEVGTEVKVMTEKKDDSIEVTVACGMVSKLVEDIDEYRKLTEIVNTEIEKICQEHGFSKASVTINNFDNVGDEERSTTHTGTSGTEDEDYPEPYMLISGTHSERGRGQTGRGNRVNGLITPMRPMPMEAAAGKPPYHPGKLYSLVAFDISQELVERIDAVDNARVYLVSRIGGKIDEPNVIAEIDSNENVKDKVEEIVNEETSEIKDKVRRYLKEPPKVY